MHTGVWTQTPEWVTFTAAYKVIDFIPACGLVSVWWKIVEARQFPVVLLYMVACIKLPNFLRSFFSFLFFSVTCLLLVSFVECHNYKLEKLVQLEKLYFCWNMIPLPIIFIQCLPHSVSPSMSLKGAVLFLDIPIAWWEYAFVRVQHGEP